MSYSERVPTENGATFCNSSVLINNEGDVLLNYRKTHLWSEYEEKRFNSGDTFSPVVEIEGTPSPFRWLSVQLSFMQVFGFRC